MSGLRHFVTAVVGLVLCVASGAAQTTGIYVERYIGPGPNDWVAVAGFPDRLAGQPGLPSVSPVTITNAGNETYRVYAIEFNTADIDVIYVVGSSPSDQPVLFVGRGATVPSDNPLPTAGARNLTRINYANCQLRVQVRVSGDITDVGLGSRPRGRRGRAERRDSAQPPGGHPGTEFAEGARGRHRRQRLRDRRGPREHRGR